MPLVLQGKAHPRLRYTRSHPPPREAVTAQAQAWLMINKLAATPIFTWWPSHHVNALAAPCPQYEESMHPDSSFLPGGVSCGWCLMLVGETTTRITPP